MIALEIQQRPQVPMGDPQGALSGKSRLGTKRHADAGRRKHGPVIGSVPHRKGIRRRQTQPRGNGLQSGARQSQGQGQVIRMASALYRFETTSKAKWLRLSRNLCQQEGANSAL